MINRDTPAAVAVRVHARADEFAPGAWLDGAPMTPGAEPVEPLPTIPGFPYLHAGAGAVMPGPTGGGRSFLMQVSCYDSNKYRIRCGYAGSEITEREFHVRAAVIAKIRGDEIDDELLEHLSRTRYLNLASVISAAWIDPPAWVDGIVSRYDVVILDPLSAVGSTLDLDFERSNSDFIRFYDTLVQPLTARGVTVVMPDNIGHAIEAKGRAKGASAKSDRADLTFPCSKAPHGLLIKAGKVRTIRAGFQTGDQWLFDRDTLQIVPHAAEQPLAAAPDHKRLTTLMDRVCKVVHEQPGIGKKAIREQVRSSKAQYIDTAVADLIADGYIRVEEDARHGHHHYPIRSFKPLDDEPACPERVPLAMSSVSPVSPGVSGVSRVSPGSVSSVSYRDVVPETRDTPPTHLDPDAEHDRLAAKYPELTQ